MTYLIDRAKVEAWVHLAAEAGESQFARLAVAVIPGRTDDVLLEHFQRLMQVLTRNTDAIGDLVDWLNSVLAGVAAELPESLAAHRDSCEAIAMAFGAAGGDPINNHVA